MKNLNELILSAEQKQTICNAKEKKNSDDDNRIRERKTPTDDKIK